ncbi:hypothetical protein ACFWZ2_27830 [Streptomyces sp. NPDC059002]|uniref:hypothetical protein n=1 Tax=Streptomyces sp. NPDC059002 TaxID=3346690 RepID=UPI00369366F7
MSRHIAASLAGTVLMATVLTAGPAAAAPAAPGAEVPEPCATIEDRTEAGLCYFELAQTLEDCSPRWKRAMAEVLASGAVQFFVNPLEHCKDKGCGRDR